MTETLPEVARAARPSAALDAAFGPAALAGDLAGLRCALDEHLRSIPAALWSSPTERARRAWTLHQTLAHVTSVAEMFLAGAEAGLAGQPCPLGPRRRQELLSWNASELGRLGGRAPDDLRRELGEVLERTERLAASASAEELSRRVNIVAYNRPMTLAQLLGNQIIHAGLVHAPQLTSVAGAPPLWVAWSPELTQRNLARLIELLSLAYWPERGGALDAAINYRVAGPGGGAWHVRVAPDGGSAGAGPAARPALNLWFRSADVFFRIITQRLGTVTAAATGRAFAWGDLKLALTMGRYFIP